MSNCRKINFSPCSYSSHIYWRILWRGIKKRCNYSWWIRHNCLRVALLYLSINYQWSLESERKESYSILCNLNSINWKSYPEQYYKAFINQIQEWIWNGQWFFSNPRCYSWFCSFSRGIDKQSYESSDFTIWFQTNYCDSQWQLTWIDQEETWRGKIEIYLWFFRGSNGID